VPRARIVGGATEEVLSVSDTGAGASDRSRWHQS
jgi:hypothetical protein